MHLTQITSSSHFADEFNNSFASDFMLKSHRLVRDISSGPKTKKHGIFPALAAIIKTVASHRDSLKSHCRG